MKIDFFNQNKWTVVQIIGRIDSFTYALFESDLQILLRTGAKFVVLDLSQNSHMNLSGFRLIKESYESLRLLKGELILLSPNDQFLTQLDYFIHKDDIRIVNTMKEID